MIQIDDVMSSNRDSFRRKLDRPRFVGPSDTVPTRYRFPRHLQHLVVNIWQRLGHESRGGRGRSDRVLDTLGRRLARCPTVRPPLLLPHRPALSAVTVEDPALLELRAPAPVRSALPVDVRPAVAVVDRPALPIEGEGAQTRSGAWATTAQARTARREKGSPLSRRFWDFLRISLLDLDAWDVECYPDNPCLENESLHKEPPLCGPRTACSQERNDGTDPMQLTVPLCNMRKRLENSLSVAHANTNQSQTPQFGSNTHTMDGHLCQAHRVLGYVCPVAESLQLAGHIRRDLDPGTDEAQVARKFVEVDVQFLWDFGFTYHFTLHAFTGHLYSNAYPVHPYIVSDETWIWGLHFCHGRLASDATTSEDLKLGPLGFVTDPALSSTAQLCLGCTPISFFPSALSIILFGLLLPPRGRFLAPAAHVQPLPCRAPLPQRRRLRQTCTRPLATAKKNGNGRGNEKTCGACAASVEGLAGASLPHVDPTPSPLGNAATVGLEQTTGSVLDGYRILRGCKSLRPPNKAGFRSLISISSPSLQRTTVSAEFVTASWTDETYRCAMGQDGPAWYPNDSPNQGQILADFLQLPASSSSSREITGFYLGFMKATVVMVAQPRSVRPGPCDHMSFDDFTTDTFTPPPSVSPQSSPNPDFILQLPPHESGSAGAIPDHISQTLVPGMSIGDAFRTVSITVDGAIFVRRGSLWSLHKNHSLATAILSIMGFSASANLNQSVVYRGGLVLRASDILTHLQWSTRTFGNKHKAFERARQLAADCRWNRTEPSGPHEQHFMEYMHWLGIVAMFKPDGWCWLDTPPDTAPEISTRECAAAQLHGRTGAHAAFARTRDERRTLWLFPPFDDDVRPVAERDASADFAREYESGARVDCGIACPVYFGRHATWDLRGRPLIVRGARASRRRNPIQGSSRKFAHPRRGGPNTRRAPRRRLERHHCGLSPAPSLQEGDLSREPARLADCGRDQRRDCTPPPFAVSMARAQGLVVRAWETRPSASPHGTLHGLDTRLAARTFRSAGLA
ncbi:hypothetical protein B0H15DRAFT_803341 [Mycena belliarum]|uniref:Uncharacterized protein n=1 Tax=Mycena belliarum TaxID=1033014 RepID=A0AAD6XL55_9AGAR|nr:hypothetical protein B0H15DRAFT_803341 [Mycena belliae]